MWTTVLVSGLGFFIAVYATKEQISIGQRKFTLHKEPKTWEMAVKACNAENGHLATIKDEAEINKLSATGGRQALWIGGRWIGSNWSWLHLGVPVSRAVPKPPQGHDCLRIAPQGGGHRLHGHDCNTPHPFACELITERDDQQHYEGVQYTVFNKQLPWEQAMEFCEERSATLATPTNYRHARFLATFTRTFRELWLGAQSSLGAWQWEPSGELLPSQREPNLYPPWMAPPPSSGGLCLLLTRGPAQIPVFQHANCSLRHNFVCQKPPWGPPGWKEHSAELEGRTYAFRALPASWAAARRDCDRLGAHLAVMTDYNTSVLIAEHAHYVPMMWLGGQLSHSTWTWDSSLDQVPQERKGRSFPIWTDPRNRNLPGHNCLAVDIRNPERPMFVPSPCSKSYVYACERADSEYQRYVKMLPQRDRQLILTEERRSFDDALKVCKRYNGTLATLNKPYLLNAVKPYIKKFAGLWVGARSDARGVMRWMSTGEEAPVVAERSLVVWEEDSEVVVTHDELNFDSPRKVGDMADLAHLPVERFRFRREAHQGQSSHKSGKEVCMQLGKRGVFVESACHIKRSFACESQGKVSQVVGEKVDLGSAHYIVFSHKVGWNRASEICSDNGAHIADLTPAVTRHINQMPKDYKDLWLGAHLQNGRWRWSDGSAVHLRVLGASPNRGCGGVQRIGPRLPVQLHAWDCNENHGFACLLQN